MWSDCVSGVRREYSRASMASLGLPLQRALGPSSGGVDVTATVAPGWSDRKLPTTSKAANLAWFIRLVL